MWAVMDRFGYRHIPFDLNGNNIHCLENILTLDIGVHSLFDELKLWFEPTVSNLLFYVHHILIESSRVLPIPTSSQHRIQDTSPHTIRLLLHLRLEIPRNFHFHHQNTSKFTLHVLRSPTSQAPANI
jgi:hypothetical protein